MQLSSVPERINKHLLFRGGVGRKLKDGMCEEKREGRGTRGGNIGESGEVFLCVHAAFFVVISAWHPTPIFRRIAPVPRAAPAR